MDREVLFGWLALCNWRGSGERNGMRTYNRNVCEHGRNKIGIEGIRRSMKDYEGIRRNTQEYAGIPRNTKEYEGIRRNTKETYIERGWGGFVWLVGSLQLEGLW